MGRASIVARRIVLPAGTRKDLLQKHLIAVPIVDVDIRNIRGQLAQMIGFATVQVNEMVFAERRLHVKRIQWTSKHEVACALRDVDARTRKGVNVQMPAN